MATLHSQRNLPLLLPFTTCQILGPKYSSIKRAHISKAAPAPHPIFTGPPAAGRNTRRRSKRSVAFEGKASGPEGGGSQFFDEDGVLNDMDGYLNYLSLEYDSVWDTKPSWCQPWTIVATGGCGIGFSWIVLHSIVVTTIVSLLVATWWYIFLYSYPKAYTEMIAERRRRVSSGVEDTFGANKDQ